MVYLGGKKAGFRPRANNDCMNSPEIVANIRKLLHELTEIPLHLLSTVYKAKFGHVLCCTEMGYSQGLPGFLRSLGGMIELRRTGGGLCLVSLSCDEPCSSLIDTLDENDPREIYSYDEMLYWKRHQCNEELFKPTSLLWANKNCAMLLNKNDIVIEKSGFELALECYDKQVRVEIHKIRKYLRMFPDGVKLSDINCLNINKRLFNIATCSNALTLELPEIFYREEDKTGGEIRVYDGYTRTIDLAAEMERTDTKALDSGLVSDAMNSGLYQKTLLLISKTGKSGLKLNVWKKSILNNFHQNGTRDEIDALDVVQFFLTLARNALVELRSANYSKNDLRAFLPRKHVEYPNL